MSQYRRPLIAWFGVIVAVSLIFFVLPVLSAQAAELKLPSGLKRIETQAFYGDTSLDAVTVQEGTEVIGSKAFARSSVRTVSLPASLFSIADDAFDGCENLTVNAQEGTYAYTWAVKNEYIKINGGAVGEETKVIVPDTLRAGADLVVQIIGPADTIQHSVYIVNEQTGEYQSAQLNKARENVTFSGYYFDSGSTYRLTVYTVTRQYQMLTPVNKTIQVTGQKPSVPSIDLPDTMRVNQGLRIRSNINDEILLIANCYSTEGELIDTYETTSYYGGFDVYSWSFYGEHEVGGTIQAKYVVHYGELWSEWSETKTIIVTPLQFGVNVIGFPDTVENGKDFGIGFEYEGYVDSCGYSIRLEDSDEDVSSIASGECQLGSDGGAGTIQIETQNLDKGSYLFTMYFYADDASKTVYQKTFEVVGDRTNPPDVTAEKTTVYVDSYIYFIVDTENAEKIAVHVEYPKGWGGTDNFIENAYGRTYRWEHWFYNEGEFKLRFAVRREGRWSAWSDPIEVLAKKKQKLASPSIHVESAITAGQDLTFSFDEVEHATFYNAGLQTTYSDNNLYLLEPATPSDLQEIPGYMLSSGNYVLEVNAGAEGYEVSSQKKYVTVNGTKPTGPEVSVEKEPQYANQNVVFSINTQNAEALQARYQISNDYSNGSYQYASIPVSGATTQWSFTIPRYWQGWECKKLTIGFSTKSNGVWSAWKIQTYDIEGLMPLSQATIHVDDEIQARTEFSIKIDPVENATQYEIQIINPYGSMILHDHRSILEEISLNSRYYDQGEYTVKVWAYSPNYASSLSEKSFTIESLPPLDPVAIHVDDTIEAGMDFSITLDSVANATRYEYGLYQGDECIRWYDDYSAVGLLRVYGYELEAGSCTIKAWAYSEDYTTSYSEKEFTVIGSKQRAPEASVDKNNAFLDEYCIFTINTTDADVLMYKRISSYGRSYSPNSISIQSDTTKWVAYNGELGTWSYTFAVLKNGIWSEWSTPITINTSVRPSLAIPAVHASETVTAGNDYTFSFDAVEHAASYRASISSAYGGGTLYGWEEALSNIDLVVPGHILNAGSYVINVSAYADGYTSSTKTIYITVSGQKAAGPAITVEEPLRIKRKASFSVDTEGAEALQVKYQYTAPNNWWSEQQISVPVTGNTTTWEQTIDEYKQGVNLTVSFAVKVNGVWSAWKTKTYTIEGLPPLDPAVIHVEDTIEAGKDFSITVDAVENASRYDFGIYKSDGWSTGIDGESTIGTETFSGSHFEPGDYTIKVRAYSDDYSSSTSEKAFTITGTKPTAPTVSVNKQDAKVRERYVFTINTENADALRYREYENIYDINVLEDETQWSTYSYYAGEYEYSFAVRRNGVWSAWSEPITINVTNYDPLLAPEISVTSPLESRRDLVVSLSEIEDATSYRIYLSKTDGTLSFSQTVYPQDTIAYTFPGYRITPGTYDISAYASNSNVSSPTTRKTIMIAETDGLPAPSVMPPENTTVASGNYVSFVIESSEADIIAARYFTPGNTNEISYSTKAVQEGQDDTTWSLYFSGSARKYSFAVRKDGVWTEWSEFITISSIQ